jgi:hypothetical protein
MTEFAGFSKRMEIRANELGEGVSKLIRKAALVIDQIVVMATPVDTGRARANWVVGVDQVPTDVRGDTQSNAGGAEASLAQGQQAIAGFGPGNSYIAIANNLDYVKFLEEGSSRQAPSGMVNQALEAGRQAIGSSAQIFTS